MNRKLLTTLLVFFCITSANAQIFFHWYRSYDSGADDAALNVSTDLSGRIHELGTRATGPFDKLVEAIYNSNGDLLVLRLGNKHLPGTLISFARDNSNNTYLVTEHSGSYQLVKYDSLLKEKWKKTVLGEIVGVKIGPDQRPVVGGKVSGHLTASKYNPATGTMMWLMIAGAATDEHVAFNMDPTGISYLAGTFNPTPGTGDISMIKVAAGGSLSMTAYFSVDLYDEPMGIYFDLTNFPYLDATSNAGTLIGTRYLTKLTPALFPLWSAPFGAVGGSGNTDVANVLFDPVNNPMVVGTSTSYADVDFPSRIFVHKSSTTTGTTIYHTTPDDPTYTLSLHEKALVAKNDAAFNIYVGGYTDIGLAPGDKRWLVTKVNSSTGAQMWTEAGSSTDGRVVDLAVTTSLDVYLAITDVGNMDLIKYSQTGPPRKRSPLIAENNNPVSVYPNPSSENFFIKTGEKIIAAEVYSLEGKLVARFNDLPADFSFGENLEKGIYILRIQTENSISDMRIVKSQ